MIRVYDYRYAVSGAFAATWFAVLLAIVVHRRHSLATSPVLLSLCLWFAAILFMLYLTWRGSYRNSATLMSLALALLFSLTMMLLAACSYRLTGSQISLPFLSMLFLTIFTNYIGVSIVSFLVKRH